MTVLPDWSIAHMLDRDAFIRNYKRMHAELQKKGALMYRYSYGRVHIEMSVDWSVSMRSTPL